MLFPKRNLAILALFSALAAPAMSQNESQAAPDTSKTTTLENDKREFDREAQLIPGAKFFATTSSQSTEEDKILLNAVLTLPEWNTFNEKGQGILQVTAVRVSQADVLRNKFDMNAAALRILALYEPFDNDRSMKAAPGKPDDVSLGDWQNQYYMKKFADKVEQELGITLSVVVIEVPHGNISMVPMEKPAPASPGPR